MSDLPNTGLSAARVVDHILPPLALIIEQAVYTAVSDDLSHIGEQAERIATALESIAKSLSNFNPDN